MWHARLLNEGMRQGVPGSFRRNAAGKITSCFSVGWKFNEKAMCTFQVQQCHSGQLRLAAVGGGAVSFGYLRCSDVTPCRLFIC